jgi:hypothetical protein
MLGPSCSPEPGVQYKSIKCNANKSIVCIATHDETRICDGSSIESDSISTVYIELIRNAKKTMIVFEFSLTCYTRMRFKLLPPWRLPDSLRVQVQLSERLLQRAMSA